ncbi:MAG: nucleoside deaminase [Kaiparowitsia implicata GSE-PSE-MK54-09C]|jgi:tRNA(Arg) A34 adenosine deaminase TadA|nr:nucleoside deaminase [Kaiparowitsia implicata GSE-PSE-MK54-09C]
MPDLDPTLLKRAIALSQTARDHGNHPFGSLLVDAEGTVLLEAENTVVTERDATGHAETNLVRLATRRYDRDFLANCTLYTSTEPCAMCAGAIYWSNIRRVVFGLSEASLIEMTGENPKNPTLSLPCREVLGCGQHVVEVVGPAMEAEAATAHAGFWD